jgi:ElaB/YqjD/DUF883 family membrane-anchored ribosome-binding protein
VRRILGGGDARRDARPAWLPALLLALTVVGMVPIVASAVPVGPLPHVDAASRAVQNPMPVPMPVPTQTPIPTPVPAMPAVQSPATAPGEVGTGRPDIAALVAHLSDQAPSPEQVEKLRAMVAEIESVLAQWGGQGTEDQLREMKDRIAAAIQKLKENEGELQDRLKALGSQLGQSDELKAKQDLIDEVRAELANHDVEVKRTAELAKLYSGWIADYKAQLDAEQSQTAAFDSKRVLALIGPALKAGPGEVSVVGDVKRPGPIKWEEGLTAAAAMARAGAPSADAPDVQIGRLSEMTVLWATGADGPDSRIRVDVIQASTPLRAGDVIIVTAGKRK